MAFLNLKRGEERRRFMVTDYNGSRSLRHVGKYLPNYELLIPEVCRIRENPKSHNIQSPPPSFFLLLEAYSIGCSCTPTPLQAIDCSIRNSICAQLTFVLYSIGRVEHLFPRTFHSKQSHLERIKLPAPTIPCQRKEKPFGTDTDNATVSHKTAPVTSDKRSDRFARVNGNLFKGVQLITVRRCM